MASSVQHSAHAVDEALNTADLRVLVACLYHLTGDEKWLSDEMRPQRDVRLVADPMAGFSQETADFIKNAARDWLLSDTSEPAITDPGPDTFGKMMSFFLGEEVPPEYVPMIRKDFGYSPEAAPRKITSTTNRRPRIAIIGAGASGLCLAHQFDIAGLDWHLYEKNDDVGGTWHENRYPGCGVDTPNHFYCYSFSPNPDWTHFFSGSSELLNYLERFADDNNLRDRVTCGTRVQSAAWDDVNNVWDIELVDESGSRHDTVDILVSATGHFNQPVTPTFDGQDSFTGQIVHTAKWPTDLDLSGKKVAVIGTGASSMQLVPTIASDLAALTIFQRTPQWARNVPEYHLAVDEHAAWLFRYLPMYSQWYRFAQLWRYGDGLLRFLKVDPEWEHPDRSLNRINERHRNEIVSYITEKLEGRPDLLDKCIPSYPPFGKRILIDNGWFDTLCQQHVTLVTDPIDQFCETGVQTNEGEVFEADVIILATGFDVTTLASRIDIKGKSGVTLADDWANENPRALLGINVPNFPNLFIMYGPNTNMGHGGSGMWLAETQSNYITQRICDMVENNVAAVECISELRDEYTDRIDELHADLIWAHPGTPTYYRTAAGKVRSPMPFRLVDYWTMTNERGLEDFITTPHSTSSTTGS